MSENDPHEPVTITDKRRIDPDTGEVREAPAPGGQERSVPGSGSSEPAPAAPGRESDTDEVAELKGTLQRVKAEYDNYRKRTLRDQQLIAERAKVAAVTQLLPVLDDLDRARSHGDLESGPLKSVADKLATALEGLGLSGFGEEGDPFDPALHEAVQHEGEGTHPIVGTVMRRGYRVGEQVVRHALVGVVDTVPEAPADGAGAQAGPAQDAE
ncbi:nucleotide exchange factor GrpE [Mycobacterium manitobense]|uniref:Protein GrpE n=1 Tax=[Mycobacterium] manitobense TaxID=190147 RepID=A0A9X2YP49_9MYCO|nr:nucleotide exchange factor GrpE [[Mycobacterium] manitobense]MCV7171553.1 nucleotide exchange factor GrpE [[Mycobacterium] manitobense]